MPARVGWHDTGHIILYTVTDPLFIEDIEHAEVELWALTAGITELVDMIFDYREVSEFPRGFLQVARQGSFAIPMLDRVALVGNEPLIEMMVTTMTHSTYRPNPTIHQTVAEAAEHLRRLAQEDTTRG